MKRRNRNRKSRKQQRSVSSGTTIGFPNQFPKRLRYTARYLLELRVGNNYRDYWVFRGNSLYDPDVTHVGSQPAGFDEMSALYGSYQCRASQITVRVNTTEVATNNAQIQALVVPFVGASVTGSYDDVLGSIPGGKYRVINLYTINESLICSSSNSRMFPELPGNSPQFTAETSANPSYVWYWHVLVDGGLVATDQDVLVSVTIDYDATFVRPIQLALS